MKNCTFEVNQFMRDISQMKKEELCELLKEIEVEVASMSFNPDAIQKLTLVQEEIEHRGE